MFHVKHFLSIKSILENLPSLPGVYKFIDDNKNVLYVGKAKNLNKRVRSYWSNSANLSGKLKVLISKTKSIEFIVTNNENEALLLENNLIKSLKPKYNVLLKDDKTYPWIKITDEEYPRIIKTRIFENDGSKYYGPYSSTSLLYTLLDTIQKIFNIRSCKLNLTEKKILENKFKPCLEFFIGNCKAPCVNNISKEEYNFSIELAEKILKGDLKHIQNFLLTEIKHQASNLQFEKAHEYKQKLDKLNNYQSKSVIVSPKLNNVDVFTFKRYEKYFFINYIKVNLGSIVQSYNLILEPQIYESDSDLLLHGINYIRELFNSNSKQIIVPLIPEFHIKDVKFINPKTGDKLKLLNLSNSNLEIFVHHFKLNKYKANYGNVNVRLLETLKHDIQLNELPVRIECFDISHHAGGNTVGSCVVFINGKPKKTEYRHFNIKSVDYIDDFAAIEEIVFRRYKRLIDEQKPFPHLIIIDGGKGQLSSALKALEKLNILNIDIIAIAKKLEEIYKPNDSIPLYLDKRSDSLKLIQRIRNEAHRFAISFHREKKLHSSFNTILDTIEGIGNKTKNKLLQHFSSIDSIANADLKTLEEIIGKSKANILYNFFHQE